MAVGQEWSLRRWMAQPIRTRAVQPKAWIVVSIVDKQGSEAGSKAGSKVGSEARGES